MQRLRVEEWEFAELTVKIDRQPQGAYAKWLSRQGVGHKESDNCMHLARDAH